ncbi:S8 family peptidase [Clostridium beijerinckii]|uniref:S8 family peptidase n=1 Tax=Clostridium beijerinckii TaxID=1520 RepID=UPI001EC714C4|nr:S8 family peptidase [Clostridium beijerinckii]NOW34915.1 subtilisin family serine protease [Clostridium beijerinckii]
MPIKVLGNDGAGYLSDIIAGIDWCITNKMDIINLSLGSSVPSTALQQEVDKAYNQGILVVAAAGNDGTSDGSTDTVDYPAKYSSVIAVAAIDSNNKRPSFSSTGNNVEVAAPGVSVLSTYLNNKYVSMSGTSMSAPFVTGDLALLKQANPGLSPNQLRAKLK